MKVTLTFVPPGGGEQDYMLHYDLPSIPQKGDYISIRESNRLGTSDFIVRRTWWHLECSDDSSENRDDSVNTSVSSIVVECEFAKGMSSSEEHIKSCEIYQQRTGKLKEFEASGY